MINRLFKCLHHLLAPAGGQAGIDRRNSFPRTPTRPLSDRDIVEQSPSLSAPPLVQPRGASREGEQMGVGIPADPFKPNPGNKLERRLSGGQRSASQKPAGNQRNGGSSLQQVESLPYYGSQKYCNNAKNDSPCRFSQEIRNE